MTEPTAASVRAAADRLRGHTVATPVIGSAWLPAAQQELDVRLKPELLQPGGSGWYRGYLHWLLRSLGELPGAVFCGPPQRALAAAIAALQHRLPLWVVLGGTPAPAFARVLEAAGAKIEVREDPAARGRELARARGFAPFPGAEHPDVAAGLATIGLELAVELPAECRTAHAPDDAAAAIVAGLAAAGREVTVIAVDEAAFEGEASPLADALLYAHRLKPSPLGLAVLGAAVATASEAQRDPIAAILLE